MPSARPATSADLPEVSTQADPGVRRLLVLAATAIAVVATGLVGASLISNGTRLHLLGGVLIRGEFDLHIKPIVILPAAIGLLVAVVGPTVVRRLTWLPLLISATIASAIWAVTLALTKDGYADNGLTGPLESKYEYLNDVPRVSGLSDLLSSYVANIPADSANPWTTHVSGHPPGPLALFALLQAIGLGGSGWAAATCIVAGVSTVPAVLVAVRALHGDNAARVVAPYLVLAPWWLWVATSADALWMGTAAWGIAMLAVAGRDRTWLLVGAGFVLGVSVFGSYGVALAGIIALAVLWHHRALSRLWLVVGGALVPVVAAGIAGFWLWQGLIATAERVAAGPAAMNRPTWYFLFANLAVAALALGPAVVGAFARSIRPMSLVWSASAAIVLADVTGLSKGEVERIWLPFYPWITVAVLLLPRRTDRRWLLAQVLMTLAIQFFIRTEW